MHVCRTSATHKLGLHDIVEESFEKLKNSDLHSDVFSANSKCPPTRYSFLSAAIVNHVLLLY